MENNKVVILWDMMQCSVINRNHSFGENCLHGKYPRR